MSLEELQRGKWCIEGVLRWLAESESVQITSIGWRGRDGGGQLLPWTLEGKQAATGRARVPNGASPVTAKIGEAGMGEAMKTAMRW